MASCLILGLTCQQRLRGTNGSHIETFLCQSRLHKTIDIIIKICLYVEVYILRFLQVDWVTMNFVPFAERCVELVVDMYKATASHTTVIQSQVLQNIIKVSI